MTNEVEQVASFPERVARLGDRAIATVIDAIAIFPCSVFIGTVVAARTIPGYAGGSYSLTGGPALLGITLILVIWITYQVVGECLCGGTFGKQIMGIQVRSKQYSTIRPTQSLIRNLFRLFGWVGGYVVGFIVAAFTANHQRVGDLVAKTIVFEHKTRRRYALFIWGCWLVLSLFSLRISENVIHLICRS
jgi:uncharacterized RDD family membrane protein YckC